MSGFRALFLIIIILGNGFLVLLGYNFLMKQLQTSLDQTYGNATLQKVLACNTSQCPQDEVTSSIKEIYSIQQTLVK